MKYPVPLKIFDSHCAILGMTGAGKTVVAKGAAEYLLDAGERVGAIDPTGAWYGMKSSKDGKRAGYDMVIFGGEHADLDVNRDNGGAVAEIVRTTDISFIVDTLLMTTSERTRFFTDFAEGLMRKKGRLRLFIDEAHVFAPQGKVPDPDAGKMLNATNTLLSAGRSRGLSICMLTQRPQKLNKDSLSEVRSLIVMQLTAPQNREAVEYWIKENADKEQAKEILSSLAKLARGTGWIWSPENDLLELAKFPMIRTYDSSSAPEEREADIFLSKPDLSKMGERLKAIVAEKRADDPKILRARIAELEKAGKAPGKVERVEIKVRDEEAISVAHGQGFAEGHARALSLASKAISDIPPPVSMTQTPAPRPARPLTRLAADLSKHYKGIDIETSTLKTTNEKVNEGISRPQQKILDAAARLEAVNVRPILRSHVAALSGASPTSSTFANNISSLKTGGFIDYPAPGQIELTTAGRQGANYPASPTELADLHNAFFELVGPTKSKILKVIIDETISGRLSVSKEDVAHMVEASATSSTFANNVSSLRSLGLINYPRAGFVSGSSTLFPEGLA